MLYKYTESLEITPTNPITNLPYDDSWVIFILDNSADYKMMCGKIGNSPYVLRCSKKYIDWEMSVCDFIGFSESQNKNILISISDVDFNKAKEKYSNHKFNDRFLRENESDILVHSTTYENWLSIKNDGCIKSWNRLKNDKVLLEEQPIGELLGDPADFSDYIMFSDGGISGEIVVLSKQNNKIIMDENQTYHPGARLYFDAEKIAKDGLLIRDGAHLKVKDEISLSKYLLWYSTYEEVGLKTNLSTPKEFSEKSDRMFNMLFKK